MILYIRRLCEIYEQNDDVQPYMKEKGNILFDLLVKTVCVSLPEEDLGAWEEVVQAVGQDLSNYIYPIGEEVVRIVGGDGAPDDDGWNKFFSWSLFQYTYILVGKDEEKRNIFLWKIILFPYIHKLNKNCPKNVNEEINMLVQRYPIVDGENAEENTIKILLKSDESDNESFWKDEGIMGGNGDNLPTKFDKKVAADISQSGWRCFSDNFLMR